MADDSKLNNNYMGPKAVDLKYIDWGWELHKKRLDFATELLRNLLTFDVAVIGIYIAFVDKKIIDLEFGKGILFFLFLSLIISFGGVLPYEKDIYLDCPAEIKEMTDSSFYRKRLSIWGSSISFFIGLLLLSLKVLNLL